MWQLLIFLWSAALCSGAAWIRYGYPQRHSSLFARLLEAEPAHVIGHLVLYGSLAALLALRHRPWLVLTLTLAVGAAQELVQVTGRRDFGSAEWFDLAVDGSAAALVVVGRAVGRREHRRVTRC